jgi:hypothetical protein
MADKVALMQVFSPSTSVSPDSFYFHRLFTLIHPPWLVQQPPPTPIVVDVPSGHGLTPPYELKNTNI